MGKIGEIGYVPEVLRENHRKRESIYVLGFFLSGVTAGILGITGVFGFLVLVLGSLLTGVLILFKGCNGKLNLYFPGTSKQFFRFGQMIGGALTFLLGWTLANNAIYLF